MHIIRLVPAGVRQALHRRGSLGRLGLLAVLVAAPLASAQTIYTCVDAKGHKTFQNSPCPAGMRIDRARDYDEAPVDPRLEAQTRQTQREMDARNRAANQDTVTTQVVVAPRGEDARDRQRRRCAEARAYRERELERVGLRRTYDLLSRLDRMVFDACKGV